MILNLNDHGKNIYHFTSARKALMYILPTMQLKLSSLTELNDPKENQTFGFNDIFSEIEYNFKYFEIRNAFEQYIRNQCKVSCFSGDYMVNANHFKFGFEHPNLWTHYADDYKGVCLVFDKSTILNEANINNINSFHDDVKYSELIIYPQISPDVFTQDINEYLRSYLCSNLSPFFYQKYLNWDNEHENRIVKFGEENKLSIKKSLIGIIIGTYFDSGLNSLLQKLNYQDIWIEQIKIIEGRLLPVLYDF